MTQRASWRSAVAACAAIGAVAAAAPVAPAQADARDVVPGFAGGDAPAGPLFRWWWPNAAVEHRQLTRELNAIARAGYAGVEIGAVMDSATSAADPDRYGYGTPRWTAAVEHALRVADRRDLQVDVMLGGRWPAGVPGLDVDGPASSKELAYGVAPVAAGATFDAALPQAAPRTYENRTAENGRIARETRTARADLVAVGAVRCTASPCAGRPLEVDLESWVDLTAQVRDGRLTWRAPDGGAWAIATFWQRGTGQRNDAPFGTTASPITDPETRVVDHFGAAGTEAMLAFMTGQTSARTRALLRRTGGSLFEDSLELAHTAAWTPSFLQEFRARRGYDLTRYLPVLAADIPASPFAPPSTAFAFAGEQAAAAERIRRDVDQTLNDLYLEHHVRPIRRWANALGLDYRAQPYGEPIDIAQASAELDIAECESLACERSDDWRAMTAGADLGGGRLVSDEMLPGGFGSVYGNAPADVVRQANAEYAAGANLMVFHGFPYADPAPAADGTPTSTPAQWPGFHAFGAGSGIPEAFGPRQPSWFMERDVAGYYARTQAALQAGVRRTDVAIHDDTLDHLGEAWRDPALARAGYTYGFLSSGALALPQATVAGGRLAPRGPAFKALVVSAARMPLATAQRLTGHAQAGLPIVVVGAPPAATTGWAADAAQAAAADAELRTAIDALLAQRTVRRVATAADVPAALASAGVAPDAVSTAPLGTVHRSVGGTEAYFLHNPARRAVRATVRLATGAARTAAPVELDAWTGRATALPVLGRADGRLRTRVEIPAGGAAIVALSPRRARAAPPPSAARRGAPVRLTRWRLVVDEFLPARGASARASDTRHVTRRLGTTRLRPWSAIPALRDASGVGTYTTTVRVSRRAAQRTRAVLDLGAVGGSFRVRVNGRWVGATDQFDPRVDLGTRLRAGRNAIEVRVATTLLNRLRVHRPADFGRRDAQRDGLLGPVRIVRYAAGR